MNCVPANGRRVLRQRHTNTCESPDCPGCEPCPEDHCRVCRHDHATNVCPGCLSMARHNLTVIAALSGKLIDEATNGRPALHVHNGVPGGNALVLLAPGNHGPLLDPDGKADPRPPLAVLTYWTEVWRARLNQPTDLPHTWSRVWDYLDGQLHLCAQADAGMFTAFYRDLTSTVRQLEDVLHDGHRPELTRVPCWECGTRLEKQYADTEADDYWRCPRCGEKYDRGRFDRAKHDHLASTGAERYVRLMDAVVAIGRPEQTVRAWVRNELVMTYREPRTGRLFVWWPDVRTQHLEAATRRRKP